MSTAWHSFLTLRRANQRALELLTTALKPHGLTAQQFLVLARLHELGASTQNALGRAVHMDQSTVQGVFVRLDALGLVQRTPDPKDRRRTRIRLSRKGTKVIEAALPAANAAAAKATVEIEAILSGERQS